MDEKLSAGSGRHCEIGILWKSVISWLPSNKQMAEARLQSVKRKLQRDEKFHIQYRQFMENFIDSGYARTLTEEEAA